MGPPMAARLRASAHACEHLSGWRYVGPPRGAIGAASRVASEHVRGAIGDRTRVARQRSVAPGAVHAVSCALQGSMESGVYLMEPKEFQPKAFYRKFDSLLAQIGKASAKDLNILVLDELAQSFGADLKIQSGCLYRRKGGSYEKVKGPVGNSLDPWPISIPRSDPALALVVEHKAYIFAIPPLLPGATTASRSSSARKTSFSWRSGSGRDGSASSSSSRSTRSGTRSTTSGPRAASASSSRKRTRSRRASCRSRIPFSAATTSRGGRWRRSSSGETSTISTSSTAR